MSTRHLTKCPPRCAGFARWTPEDEVREGADEIDNPGGRQRFLKGGYLMSRKFVTCQSRPFTICPLYGPPFA